MERNEKDFKTLRKEQKSRAINLLKMYSLLGAYAVPQTRWRLHVLNSAERTKFTTAMFASPRLAYKVKSFLENDFDFSLSRMIELNTAFEKALTDLQVMCKRVAEIDKDNNYQLKN